MTTTVTDPQDGTMVAGALPHQSDELGLDPPPSETAAVVVVVEAAVTSEFSFHLPPVYRTVLRVKTDDSVPLHLRVFP